MADPQDLPDTLYLSDGNVADVTLVDNTSFDSAPVLSDLRVELAADVVGGWSYLKMDDPSDGLFELIGVERSDGTVLPAENFWQTDRTFIGGGQRPILENKLHLVDHNSTGQYTLIFSNGDLMGPETIGFTGVEPNPTTEAIDVIDVTFSERLADNTFEVDDLALLKNGVAVTIDAEVVVGYVSGTTYRISGLANHAVDDAVYELVVNTAGLTDQVGNVGVGEKIFTWVKGEAAPVVLQLVGAPSGLTTSATPSIDIVMSKPILLDTLTIDDLSLTFDGNELLDGQVTIAQVGVSTYRIGNLGRLTDDDGGYQFTVDAGGLEDLDAIAGLGTGTAQWTLDTTPPVLEDLFGPATNPRNIVVQQVDIEFSESIDLTTFDVDDLVLTRDGGDGNLLTDDDRVSFEDRGNNVYRVRGINWVQAFTGDPQIADFTLTVDASGITDLAGNPGVGTLSASWTIDLDDPSPATSLLLETATGPVMDGMINSLTTTLAGELAESGLTVAVRDMTTGEDLARQTVDGLAFSLPITFPSFGQHRLRVRAIDAAGNTTDTFMNDLFVTESSPTVASIVGLPEEFTNGSIDTVDVTFATPIDPATLTMAALQLTRNGGPNLINEAVSIEPQDDGLTYRFAGLGPITGAEGRYELSLDFASVANVAGVDSSERRTHIWTNDQVYPESSVTPLDAQQDLNSFVVTVDGADPDNGEGLPGSGIDVFDLYYSVDGGPFELLETLSG